MTTVRGLPTWIPLDRLLGEGPWVLTPEPDGTVTAEAALKGAAAADVSARLRGLGFGGHPITVTCVPELPRALVRAARTEDAKRRRDTTPGFLRNGTLSDAEGKMSLTPESLALTLGRRANGLRVVDAGCGIGGNSIGFARGGGSVTAVERDPQRIAMARHNAKAYGVRIAFIEGDAVAEAARIDGDVLFVDPPWGADYDRVVTRAPDFPLLEALVPLVGTRYRELWAKLPPSFDPATLPKASPEAVFGEAPGDRQRVKFTLLRLRGD